MGCKEDKRVTSHSRADCGKTGKKFWATATVWGSLGDSLGTSKKSPPVLGRLRVDFTGCFLPVCRIVQVLFRPCLIHFPFDRCSISLIGGGNKTRFFRQGACRSAGALRMAAVAQRPKLGSGESPLWAACKSGESREMLPCLSRNNGPFIRRSIRVSKTY